MRFELTADQRLLRSTTAGFLEKFSSVSAARALHEENRSFDRQVWQGGAELGWVSLLVPESLGGGCVSDDGLVDATIIAEQFGRATSPGPLIPVNVVASALSSGTPSEAHVEVLRQLMSGSLVASWAGQATSRGWDPAAAAVEAHADGSDLRLQGVHDAVEAAAEADYLLTLARTPDGLVQVLVPKDSDGLTVHALASLDLTRSYGRVRYDDVRVPADAIVTHPAEASAAIEQQLQIAVVLQCAELVGAIDKVLEFTLQWLFNRYTFGRPLASYQELKHRVADMTLWFHVAQAATAAAARAVARREQDAGELASVAKAYTGEKATQIIQDCVQLHGGLGVTWEHDIHLYLRRATVDRMTWGTPAEHRRRIADLLNV